MAVTPTLYSDKATHSEDVELQRRFHMAILDAAQTVQGEPTTGYTAGGALKRRDLARAVLDAAEQLPNATTALAPVFHRIINSVLATWASGKDLELDADLANQVAARWNDIAGIDAADIV